MCSRVFHASVWDWVLDVVYAAKSLTVVGNILGAWRCARHTRQSMYPCRQSVCAVTILAPNRGLYAATRVPRARALLCVFGVVRTRKCLNVLEQI